MADLWVPPAVQARAQNEYRAHAATLADQYQEMELLRHWNEELRRFDPHLQLVKAREDSDHPALKPGYYHLLRSAPGSPPNVIVHQGPNGEFREPDSQLFDELRRSDFWNDRAVRDRKKRERELERAKTKAQEAERADRVAELTDRVKSNWGTSVSLAKTNRPWTQNRKARHG